jgi:hypothetical protein
MYLCIKFHILSCNDPLAIAVKMKVELYGIVVIPVSQI